jgi:hypothetical protein
MLDVQGRDFAVAFTASELAESTTIPVELLRMLTTHRQHLHLDTVHSVGIHEPPRTGR